MDKLKQEFRIKELLGQRRDVQGRRMNMTSLALVIGEPYGTVAGVVYGNRVNPAVRAKIAEFLGRPVEELFGVNGEEAAGTAGGDARTTEAGATKGAGAAQSGVEVSHG